MSPMKFRRRRYKARLTFAGERTPAGDRTVMTFKVAAQRGSPVDVVLRFFAMLIAFGCQGPSEAWRVIDPD